MFNDKTIKKRGKIAAIMTGAAVIALAATFGYSTVANAQIQATVSKPALRTQYMSTDTIDLSGSVNLKNGNQKISVSLRDSDLKPALRMIADKAGLNIIFHNSVSGRVTLDLVNVSLNDAFKMIMQTCDLSYVTDNDTLIVMSKDASLSSDISKQNMMTLPVKYADSSKLAEFLNTNVFSTNRPGLSNNKIVVTNPVTNELIIFGTTNDYKMAQKVVAKLDVAPKTNSYRINHTTPKEMATLICQSLFPDAQGSAGAGDLGGMMTGGAASSGGIGDSSASSGDFGGDSGSGTADEITLGEGKVACTIKPSSSGASIKSLSGSAMTITYFPSKGTINVTGGSDSQAEMIKNFILANDKKQPQAYIDVQVVDLNEDGSKSFQNNWHILTPFFSATFSENGLSNAVDGVQTPMFFTGGPHYTVTKTGETESYNQVYDRWHGRKTVGWAINYLIENKKGRLLANPKVVVTNGKKSTINITEDYVKSVEEEIMTNTGYGQGGVSRTYEIEEDDLGLVIEITPFISPDGYITLNLKPQFATIAGKEMSVSSVPGGQPYTAAVLLKRRSLDLSNIRVKDGETLVLGGLVQEEENKTVQKVPLLGDLPVIGGVFRNTITENTKSELIIMVTPHIIQDTEDAMAEADESENL